MKQGSGFSLLQPVEASIEYHRLPDHVIHDLGLETFRQEVSGDSRERRLIANVLSQICGCSCK